MYCLIALTWSAVLQQRLHEPICSSQSTVLLYVKYTVHPGSCSDVRARMNNVIMAIEHMRLIKPIQWVRFCTECFYRVVKRCLGHDWVCCAHMCVCL